MVGTFFFLSSLPRVVRKKTDCSSMSDSPGVDEQVCASFDDDVTEVLPRQLYQGSLLSLEPATLARLGITHVVNAAAHELKPRVYTHAPIAHCNLLLEDSESAHLFNMPVNLIDAYRFISDALAAGGRVLVFCAQGKSRSSSVTLFYLVKSRQQHVDVALAELCALRPIVKPNPSFMQQLRDYCTDEEIAPPPPSTPLASSAPAL
jgi:predicted protein tyrosine phosphatase